MGKEIQQIMDELKGIKEEIQYIRDNMPNKEMFLGAEEKQLLKDSFEHEKTGKLISGKDLKKKLRL